MIDYSLKGPVSQERARIRLMSALRENRFPQAILIDGPTGIGKKALAMEIAKALQCTDPAGRPCGHCFGCRMAAESGATENWIIPLEAAEARAKKAEDATARSTAKTIEDIKQDYIKEIIKNPYRVDIFSAAAFISVELMRTMTSSFAMRGDRVRTVIIAEADRMNEAASNAFLKTLEDVPPDTYFILTTSSREKMLQTIRSRCLALHLLPLTDDEVQKEAARVADEDFDRTMLTDDVVGMAVGSPGKALYYAPLCEQWNPLAVDFIRKSLLQDYTDLFFALKEASLEDPYVANRFLEVMSFLVADLLRELGGAPLRMPTTTASIGLKNFPRIDATALELALVDIQETMSRIESRRATTTMSLQTLALKLFEGYK
ncbi:AAA family ATPase [Fibrobacter sp. UWEL]|uniref:DNA polymerase III subunit n=1 Tax=Fibrobacter sp. UWEL TaxID=1896209 RepID=UPI00091146E7|nr:AAA family ATPase [Fibrobacter sp. UWEL]SHL40022.1 DNA polymerase-3 subunit delta' [Fibrobacter sp. UWEL]